MSTIETLFWAFAACCLGGHAAYMAHHAWRRDGWIFMSIFSFFAGLQIGCLITLLGKLIT